MDTQAHLRLILASWALIAIAQPSTAVTINVEVVADANTVPPGDSFSSASGGAQYRSLPHTFA